MGNTTKTNPKPDSKPTRIRVSSLERFQRIAHRKRMPTIEVIDVAAYALHMMPKRQLDALIERQSPEPQ